MIALNIQRTGLTFMAVDGAPRDSGDLLIVDDSDSIANHRDMPAHQRYVVGLPCAGPPRNLDTATLVPWFQSAMGDHPPVIHSRQKNPDGATKPRVPRVKNFSGFGTMGV